MSECSLCGHELPSTEKYHEGFPDAARRLVESGLRGMAAASAREAAGSPRTALMVAEQMDLMAPSGLDAPGASDGVPEAPEWTDDASRIAWMLRTTQAALDCSLSEAMEFVSWVTEIETEEMA